MTNFDRADSLHSTTSSDGAPTWQTSAWFNSEPSTLNDFRGRVVVMHAFQMLCPGCVSHGLPLMHAIRQHFPRDQVVCIGLHSVFEHHTAMTNVALEAFLHEYRIDYPVAVDQAGNDGDPRPLTMRAYHLRGTPSLLIFDRAGRLAAHEFGAPSQLAVGATIAGLLSEADLRNAADQPMSTDGASTNPPTDGCSAAGCAIPG